MAANAAMSPFLLVDPDLGNARFLKREGRLSVGMGADRILRGRANATGRRKQ